MIRGTWSLTDPVIPASLPAAILHLGVKRGASTQKMLENTDIEASTLSNPKTRINYQQLLFICNNLMDQYPNGDSGLELGAAINVNHLGMLGYALLSCRNLSSALELGIKYHRIVNPAFTYEIVEPETNEEFVTLRFTSHIPYEQIYKMTCDAFVTSMTGIARFLTGNSELQPYKVHFNRPAPAYSERYKEFLDCPVLFDQPRTEIILYRAELDKPLMMANESTAEMAEYQCAEILARLGTKEGIVSRVRKILLCDPGTFPSVDEVASQLATSTRTLSRSLQEVDTSYQKILDDVRQELAIEYLQKSSLPIEEIALLIGYNDPSNFRKAFRRWTHNPPSYYRKTGTATD